MVVIGLVQKNFEKVFLGASEGKNQHVLALNYINIHILLNLLYFLPQKNHKIHLWLIIDM